LETSLTCRIKAASCTSSSVARNAVSNPFGRSRINPTVSETSTRRFEGSRSARMVGSSVANILGETSTSARLRALNAGKSTLFNALSRAEVLVSPRMFATLDPTIRALRLPSNRRVLVSDTVGFIRDLPKGLLTAFRATLEEVQEAALILHVSDVSNPHHDELDEEVDKILRELGVDGRPRLRVLNKMYRLTPEHRRAITNGAERSAGAGGAPVLVSALTSEGIEEMLRRMDAEMPTDPVVTLSIRLPLAEGRTLALIHALGRVLHSEIDDSHMRLDAEVPASIAKRLRLKEYAVEEPFRALSRNIE